MLSSSDGMLLEQADVIGDRLTGEITRVMAAHAIGYDPHILLLVHQERVFVLGSDVAGIGDAMAEM